MHLRRAYPVKEGAVNKSDRFHCRVAPAANVNSLLVADAVFMISLAGPSNFADIFSFCCHKGCSHAPDTDRRYMNGFYYANYTKRGENYGSKRPPGIAAEDKK